eukprot:788639-Prorocentrum_minimum.AAC.1
MALRGQMLSMCAQQPPGTPAHGTRAKPHRWIVASEPTDAHRTAGASSSRPVSAASAPSRRTRARYIGRPACARPPKS